MSYIRERYEELFPETTWSDEKIIANMFRGRKTDFCPKDMARLEVMSFETDDELYDYLKSLGAVSIDCVINGLISRI